jgi:uncharacterized membrane protein
MAFCSQCGSPVEGKFCAKCGAPAGEAGTGPAKPDAAPAVGLTPTLTATLCYIPVFIPAVLFLVWGPHSNDKTVRFHALQSLFLQLAYLVVAVVLGMVLGAMFVGPLGILSRLLNLAFLGLVVYLMYQTYQHRRIVLPVIGPFAEKQA